ncbi:DUF2577 domain-containing protein [Leuconostoc carnosum]|uniref:DUF2577 domain-containing protein n=1 Tax=Leuconostoc TaxID=1243 RepID=UPI0012387E8B|nr:DUF2577 domain-containing protein [Leuconostoc carnosum]KAA8371098.1 DUF2577 domain-containing protein [Leuconostoc carnosum]KAA8382739.1 DUF2577 domain-containing protein [Leuconostoc carnosum]
MAGEQLIEMIMQRHGSSTEYADIVFGTVVSINSLAIQVGDKLTLPSELLILGQHVSKRKIKVDGKLVEIDQSLKINDGVVMIRMDGGQTFFILEKIVREKS